MNYDKLFESILDDITTDDVKSNASGRLADTMKTGVLDSNNIPLTSRFTQMLAFMCGLKSRVSPVPGLIKQELDKFCEDVDDIFHQTPEVSDWTVCVLTGYDFYKDIDPRVQLFDKDKVAQNNENFSTFRLNFCVCWNRPLKNPRTVRLLMRAFNRTLRGNEFLEFDNMCCRIVEDNHWKAKYFIRFLNFDNYISIQSGLKDIVHDSDNEFWNIYNLQRWLCQTPKLFYNLQKLFGEGFDNSNALWRHMLLGVADMRLFGWYEDNHADRYVVSNDGPVSKLIGTKVSPVIFNDYDYAVVCIKLASSSNYRQDMYAQASDSMGNDVLLNAVRAQVYAGRAIIRKCMFLRTNEHVNMCMTLFDPIWIEDCKSMAYFGIVYINNKKKSHPFITNKKKINQSLNQLISGMFKSFAERPPVTQKAVYEELKSAKREFAYRPARN